MSVSDNPKLAVLIDADNASASLAKELLEEVAKFGVATVKRAYGDWTSQHLVGWKEALNRHAIQPIQQFAYTRGKNSTDASLIIDAMDLLYADNVDGFCLVSSDSDFTRLATRLRESRKVVYGLGERKTPEAFRAACDRFVFFEVLKRGGSSVDTAARETAPSIGDVPDLEQSLRQAFDAVSRDNGWATVSSVGSYMAKNNPSFDTRLYGFRKLSDMIRKQPFVEVKESTDANGGPLLAVRLKARVDRHGRDGTPPRGAARGRAGASEPVPPPHRAAPVERAAPPSVAEPHEAPPADEAATAEPPNASFVEFPPVDDGSTMPDETTSNLPSPMSDGGDDAGGTSHDDVPPAKAAGRRPARGRRAGSRTAASDADVAGATADAVDVAPRTDASPDGANPEPAADSPAPAAKRSRRKRS